MCLAADVPLIESGTTGFNGQVQVIKKVNVLRTMTCSNKAHRRRAKRNATTVIPKRPQRLSLFVRFEVLPVNPYTVLFGQKATSLRTAYVHLDADYADDTK